MKYIPHYQVWTSGNSLHHYYHLQMMMQQCTTTLPLMCHMFLLTSTSLRSHVCWLAHQASILGADVKKSNVVSFAVHVSWLQLRSSSLLPSIDRGTTWNFAKNWKQRWWGGRNYEQSSSIHSNCQVCWGLFHSKHWCYLVLHNCSQWTDDYYNGTVSCSFPCGQ